MQVSASVGGECVVQSLLEKTREVLATGSSPTNATEERKVAMFCWAEADFASGWEIGAVFLGDVAQQVLFAQQADWQAFWFDVLDRMQVRAETHIGPAASAAAITSEIVILLNMQFPYSTS
jgi:xanthine/CO dehydrogenase XdhC/CoxF family maturation factor